MCLSLSLALCLCLSVCLSLCLCLSVCLSLSVPVSLYVSVSVCLSVCLYIYSLSQASQCQEMGVVFSQCSAGLSPSLCECHRIVIVAQKQLESTPLPSSPHPSPLLNTYVCTQSTTLSLFLFLSPSLYMYIYK